MFPLCYEAHWVVYSLDVKNKILYFFNSVDPEASWPIHKKVIKHLWPKFFIAAHTWSTINTGEHLERWDGPFQVMFAPDIKQPDSNCCGLMVLLFAQFWNGRLPECIKQGMVDLKIIENLRKKICNEILLAEDNKFRSFVIERIHLLKTPAARSRKKMTTDETKVEDGKKGKTTKEVEVKKEVQEQTPLKESKAATDRLNRQYFKRQKEKKEREAGAASTQTRYNLYTVMFAMY